MINELKSCPFCGLNLEVWGSPITRNIKKVQHPTADCLLSGQTWWHVPRFIGPWNTRADLSRDLVRAALKSLVAKIGQLEVDQHNNCKSEDYSDGISDCFDLAVKISNDPEAVESIITSVLGEPT